MVGVQRDASNTIATDNLSYLRLIPSQVVKYTTPGTTEVVIQKDKVGLTDMSASAGEVQFVTIPTEPKQIPMRACAGEIFAMKIRASFAKLPRQHVLIKYHAQ